MIVITRGFNNSSQDTIPSTAFYDIIINDNITIYESCHNWIRVNKNRIECLDSFEYNSEEHLDIRTKHQNIHTFRDVNYLLNGIYQGYWIENDDVNKIYLKHPLSIPLNIPELIQSEIFSFFPKLGTWELLFIQTIPTSDKLFSHMVIVSIEILRHRTHLLDRSFYLRHVGIKFNCWYLKYRHD